MNSRPRTYSTIIQQDPATCPDDSYLKYLIWQCAAECRGDEVIDVIK
jgi:hypothetical protein